MTQLNPNKRKILMAPKSPALGRDWYVCGRRGGFWAIFSSCLGRQRHGLCADTAPGAEPHQHPPEILQRTTTMPVIEALDPIPDEPGTGYVIPPNRDTAIFHGVLQLTVSCC
ncbi:hypothetical protein [Methyloglobulus morosus]